MKITSLPNYCYLIKGAKLQTLKQTISTFEQINQNLVIPPTHILIASPNRKIQTIDQKISDLQANFDDEIILLDRFWLQFHKEASYFQQPFFYLTIGQNPNKKSLKVLANLDSLQESNFSNCYFWLV